MGAKGMGIGSIVLGAALIVLAFTPLAPVTAIGWIALFATSATLIAGGAFSLTFDPQSQSAADNRARDISLATAGEGFPVPVVFGEQKITGNFINYSKDTFRSEAVYGESGVGGKGGGPAAASTIGYEYFLSFEYAICMGQVDQIAQVWSAPGEKPMMGVDPTAATFGGSDYAEALLDEVDPQNPQGRQGGLIRIYKGSQTQTRVNPGATDPYIANGMNYRGLCWALFMDFKLGRIPQPRTYQFIVRRLPVVKRDDGSTIAGFQVRGSGNTTHPNYIQANPAAILYEVATNKEWGRGLSSDLIDEASFIAASQYFYDKNIGLGITLDRADKIGTFLEGVRQHVKTITVFDGDKLKCRCLLNAAETHTHIQSLTRSDCISLDVRRPFWPATVNEVRLEFLNAKKNYRPDVAIAQDIANMAITGKINPQRITLNGFCDMNTARRQAFRILRDISYPLAAANLVINRFKSQLQLGDAFRLTWDEWGANTITAYFLVTRVDESDTENEDLKITAIEDPNLSPFEGTETGDIYPTVQPWEQINDLDEDEVALFKSHDERSNEIFPITAIETPQLYGNLNFNQSGNFNTIMQGFITGQKSIPGLVGMALYWAAEGSESYVQFGSTSGFSWTGEILEDVPARFCDVDMTDAGFQFSLTNSADESEMLGFFNLMASPTAHIENLANSPVYFAAIGEEFFQIGLITKLGTNLYRAQRFLRARWGSAQASHQTGEGIYLYKNSPPSIDLSPLPLNTKIKIKAYPTGTGGQVIYGAPRDVVVNINPANTIGLVGHGFKQWNGIQFLYGSAPTPIVATATYYCRDITPTTFKIAAAVGGGPITITAAGATVRVRAVLASPFYFFHQAAADFQYYRGVTRRPFAPEYISHFNTGTGNTDKYVITLKVRYIDKATAQFPLFGTYDTVALKNTGAISRLVTNGSDLSFVAIGHTTVGGDQSDPVTNVSFTPDQFNKLDTGCFQISVPRYHANNLSLPIDYYKIYTSKNGFRSNEFLLIEVP
jgi:hypothetical protein